MSDESQNLASIALLLTLKKIEERNALISVDRKDDVLLFENKLGKKFEFQLPKGEQGERGDTGEQGIPGESIKGDQGDKGDQGLQGEQGIKGDSIKGDKGEQGDRGLRGLRGLSVKGDKGLSVKGDKGDKGDKGEPGDPITAIGEPKFFFDQRGHWIINMFGKTYDMGLLKSGGGGSGSLPFVYTNSAPMPQPVGGFAEGTTFDQMDLNSLWTGLLYASQIPSFTSFYINFTATVYEVGDGITEDIYQATWIITSPEFLTPNSIKIEYIHDTTTLVLASSLPDTFVADINVPEIIFDTPTIVSFKITGISTLDAPFSKSLLVRFLDRIYVGETNSATLDSSGISSLRLTQLTDNINGEYQTEEGGYKWICFPTTMGQRFNFIDDATELEISMDDYRIVSVTNLFGVTKDYYAYRSYYILHAAIKIRVY